ncbi:flavin reductase [Actinoplanes sp. ATCC 53533]|uniref:flavin reductase family protein n=1 Tax=Actinoplanes sp. ATCC 53533 TaxID=1288362 RepID=UPI000F7A3B1B|nr:flavin reductase family protein [Actinoplanes sp. ATCC 53533]RSM70827.1 flavin reductase [Actinoplanes sp. ATCC 53533]
MMPAVTRPSPYAYRQVAGRFATGVTVLTVAGPHGCTVSSFTSVSLEPLLVSVCLNVDSSSLRELPDGRRFAVTILAAHQRALARHFADPRRAQGPAQFDGWAWRPGAYSAAPLLAGALGWLECRVVRRIPAGDHVIVLAEVHTVRCGTGAPLVHFDGDLVAGAAVAPPGEG